MNLQEKINKRLVELEVDLKELNNSYINSKDLDELDYLSSQLSIVEVCIKELKQLLNN